MPQDKPIHTDIFDGLDFDPLENANIFDNLDLDDHEFLIEGVNYDNMFHFVSKDKKLIQLGDESASTSLVDIMEDRFKGEVRWAKKHLKKKDRIVWYLRLIRFTILSRTLKERKIYEKTTFGIQATHLFLKEIHKYNKKSKGWKLQTTNLFRPTSDYVHISKGDLVHFLSLDIPAIQDIEFTWQRPFSLIQDMERIEIEWKKTRKSLIQDADQKVIIKFNDEWSWFDLDKATCEDEGDAMGHCGNRGEHKASDTIFSLRQKKLVKGEVWWKPLLTFIMDTKTGLFAEMKGRGNDKPEKKFHKYIIPLLMHKRVNGIIGGGYKPENNFSVMDLNKSDRDKILKKSPDFLNFDEHIKNGSVPSEEQQLDMMSKFGRYIKDIKNPSEAVQLAAIKDGSSFIKYIKNPTETVQKLSVKKLPLNIEYIENPSEEVQLIAVGTDGHVIQYIKNPSEKVKLAAVKENGMAIKWIKNPSEKVQWEALITTSAAVKRIKNPSEKVLLRFIKSFPSAIGFVPDPSEKLLLTALEKDQSVKKYIDLDKVPEHSLKKVMKAAGLRESIFDGIDEDDHEFLIEGVNYDNMLGNFKKEDKRIQKIMRKISRNDFPKLFKQEILWAKKHLKKSGRVVWYLRWIKVHFMENLYDYQIRHKSSMSDEDQRFIISFINKEIKIYNKKTKGKRLTITTLKDNLDVKYLRARLDHFYGLGVNAIDTIELGWEGAFSIVNKFKEIEDEWKLTRQQFIPEKDNPEDEFIKLDSKFSWYDLKVSSCTKEGNAMGHCGNTPMSYSTEHTILSLREKVIKKSGTWFRPVATFILHKRSGMLGEMKGRANEKPQSKYHKYIIPLLMHKRIKGIDGGGYIPESNFSVLDLPESDQKKILKKSENFLSFSERLEKFGIDDKMKETLEEVAQETSSVRIDDEGLIIQSDISMEDVVDQYGNDTLKYVFKVMTGDEHLELSGYGYSQDVFKNILTGGQVKKIKQWILDNIEEEEDDTFETAKYQSRNWVAFLQDFPDNDKYDLVDPVKAASVVEELNEIFRAFDAAERFGTESEMYEDFQNAINYGFTTNRGGDLFELVEVTTGGNPTIDSMFEVHVKWDVLVGIIKDEGYTTPEEIIEGGEDFFQWTLAIEMVPPRNGWQEFDDKHFEDEVERILKVLDK